MIHSHLIIGGAIDVISTTLEAALSSCGCRSPSFSPADCVLSVKVYNATTPSEALLLGTNSYFPVAPKAITTMRDPILVLPALLTMEL